MNAKKVSQLYDLWRASAEATLKAAGVELPKIQEIFLRDETWKAARRTAVEAVVNQFEKLEKDSVLEATSHRSN